MTLVNVPHLGSTCTTCPIVSELRAELDQALRDPIWGIYSRQGIERRMRHLTTDHATIVVDMDKMHHANTAFGHDGVDSRITRALACIRSADVLAGRWLRGDEVVLFPLAVDAIGLAHRLLGALLALDMSATIAVVWGNDRAAVTVGTAQIETAKEQDQRGRVFVVGGGVA